MTRTLIAKLRAQADALTHRINATRPAPIGTHAITERRAHMIAYRSRQVAALEHRQAVLRALATAHARGTLPLSLRGLRNQTQVRTLLSWDIYPAGAYRERARAHLRAAGITAATFQQAKADLLALDRLVPMQQEAPPMTPPISSLPATVRFAGPWSEEDRAQVITTLTPLIPALSVPWLLTYEHDATATARTRAVIAHAYSATVERDGEAQPVLSRCWDLGMYLRQLAAYVRAQAEGQTAPAVKPIRRSPLEIGQWLTKQKFEQRYQPQRWLNVVVIDGGTRRVRVSPYKLITLIRTHAAAYFQFAWNDQPHTRQQKIAVKGRRSAERFETIPVTDPPYTTVKLRICYALTPERDTEVTLHDGYGLPEIDRWWERMTMSHIALPLPAEAQAMPELAYEVAAS
ncbi:MAG TPA: hypothetical protein VGD58_32955 [Herpetosiphonaceae bacterium]